MKSKETYICLPPSLNLTAIRIENNVIFYTYNSFFYYYLISPVDAVDINVDIETKGIIFKIYNKKVFERLYINLLHKFFFSWDSYFFEKIKFTGKGYRIAFQKKKKIMKFYFGHSHDTLIVFKWVVVKKPHKYKFIILKNNITTLRKLNETILRIKPINIYTKRGLRNFRQIIYKRKGKKSSY